MPIITFLSDYGLEGAFVGACHGVMVQVCPKARIIDVTHGIPRHDIRIGALALRDALPYLPKGVNLAVVDPEVGGERLAIAIRAMDGRYFVGPDTGMLQPALARIGGIAEAANISNTPHRLRPTSATFHGRDIFSPVTARLALGDSLEDVGELIDPSSLVQYELPKPLVTDDTVLARVLTVDRFGNAVLNLERDDLGKVSLRPNTKVELTCNGNSSMVRFTQTFADVPLGDGLLYVDAQGMLALAVNQGSAASTFGLELDTEISIRRPAAAIDI